MRKPIRAVLFDLDGTLLPLDFDRFFVRYLDRLAAWYRKAMGIEIVAPAMAAAAFMLRNDGPRSNADVFWSAAAPKLGRDRAALERLYEEFVLHEGARLGEGITPDPSARAVVEASRAAGRRVALATNPVFPRCMIDERARWAGLDLDGFDLVTCSERMQHCKPHPGYYRDVADALGVEPEECLMIGNDVAMDLRPAAAVGMRTCLLRGEFTVEDGEFAPDHRLPLAEVPSLLAA